MGLFKQRKICYDEGNQIKIHIKKMKKKLLLLIIFLSLFALSGNIPKAQAADINFGAASAQTFGSAITTKNPQSIARLDDTHVVITYVESYTGKAVVGTITGTHMSLGTPVTFTTSDIGISSKVVALSSTKFVVAYRTTGESYRIYDRVGIVSGNSISFSGSAEATIVLTGAAENYGFTTESTFTLAALDSSLFFVAWQIEDWASGFPIGQYTRGRIGSVSGQTITHGTAVDINSSTNTTYTGGHMLSATPPVLLAQRDYNVNGKYGIASIS